MERIITEKLTYLLEKIGLISKYQSGFRKGKGRGTMDPIVCLEIEIRKGQINKERVSNFWMSRRGFGCRMIGGLNSQRRKLNQSFSLGRGLFQK